MATFEVTIHGERYEVTAPDERSAIEALRGHFPDAFPDQAVAPQGPQDSNWLSNAANAFGQGAQSAFTGAMQGATMGGYDELASFLGAPVKGMENILSGRDSIQGAGDVLPFLGRSFESALAGQQALTQQSFDQAPAAYIAGDLVGSLGLGTGLAARGATMFGDIARPTVLGMAGRGAIEGGLTGATTGFNAGESEDTGLDARLRAAASGAGAGALVGGLTGGVLGGMAGRAQTDAIPSVQDLKDQASSLYAAARNSGVQASPQMSQRIANTIEGIASAENVRLPSGKVNQTYPKIAGVLNVFDEYSGRPLDVGQMQAIRRNLQDAAKSLDPGERRIATIMLGEFDDFATGVAPELAEASELYWRSKLGETIEEAIELAENRAGQYSQSGMENALRTQFRQLNAKIIKGQLRGIPNDLAEQIRLVADGSPIQNFARSVGKFAVRGPVSGIPTIAAALSGGAAGGPVGGALAAGAVAVPTELGRMAAERMAIRNADVASALARSGGSLPAWSFAPASGGVVQALSGTPSRLMPNF